MRRVGDHSDDRKWHADAPSGGRHKMRFHVDNRRTGA
jgi:hypothetical protein